MRQLGSAEPAQRDGFVPSVRGLAEDGQRTLDSQHGLRHVGAFEGQLA